MWIDRGKEKEKDVPDKNIKTSQWKEWKKRQSYPLIKNEKILIKKNILELLTNPQAI